MEPTNSSARTLGQNMFDNIVGWVVLCAGGALIGYATFGRLLGLHRPTEWQTGGEVTLVAELAIGVLFVCPGLLLLRHFDLALIPTAVAIVVLFISGRRAHRRHVKAATELRARNAANYPGVFDPSPPDDIDAICTDEFDIFDNAAATYLGRARKRDLKALIDRYGKLEDDYCPNDIFLLPEFLETLPKGSLNPEFVALLQPTLEKRGFLVLRWLPPTLRQA